MSRYKHEREAFRRLKQAIESSNALKADVENALDELLSSFSTAIRENRFVVGGVLEVILIAAMRAAGIEARDVGSLEQRIDVKLPEGGFSIKGHFSRSQSGIRLINTLGASEQTTWETATIFVIHGLGIGYADPELIPADQIVRAKDALVLPYKVIRDFLTKNSEYLIQVKIPLPLSDLSKSALVSRSVAREILQRTKILKSYLSESL